VQQTARRRGWSRTLTVMASPSSTSFADDGVLCYVGGVLCYVGAAGVSALVSCTSPVILFTMWSCLALHQRAPCATYSLRDYASWT